MGTALLLVRSMMRSSCLSETAQVSEAQATSACGKWCHKYVGRHLTQQLSALRYLNYIQFA